MRKYLWISLGGILGAILRYLIKSTRLLPDHWNIPIDTLLINIIGSFILALVLTIAFEVWSFDANIRLGIATGFLGAFTTFSTLCKESAVLLAQGDYFSVIFYLLLSTVMGMAAAFFGVVLAREAVAKLVRQEKDLPEEDASDAESGVE